MKEQQEQIKAKWFISYYLKNKDKRAYLIENQQRILGNNIIVI